jgi:hypothetical protein
MKGEMRGLGKKERLIRGKRKRSEERRRIGSTRRKKRGMDK